MINSNIDIRLKCQFDDFLLDVNEQFPSDKITGLFGKSGSGKSRLIRQILGFDLRYQKQSLIQFNSSIWQNRSENLFKLTENRGIGYLPQSVDLFPHLSVKNNIQFSSKNRVIDEKLYQSVLNDCDIENLTNKLPSQLSGGQKQRVGLARALFTAKNLLVLDEPLSAIGEDHKPKIMKLLKAISKKNKLPIIFSSHNRYEHAYLTEHLLHINDGIVEQSGNYSDISTDINNNFAQKADAINHLKAKAINFDTNYCVNQLESQNITLWAGYQLIEKDSYVNLEVRAKDISISLKNVKHSSILNCLPVQLVESIEISSHQYMLKLAFNEAFIIAFITKKSFFDLNLINGLDVFAVFKAVSVLPISD